MGIHRRLFLVFLALIPVQLGWHYWPEWAYILGRKVDYLSPTLYLTDILIFVLCAAWIISTHTWRNRHKRLGIPLRSVLVILAVTIFAGINTYLASDSAVALYKWTKIIELAILGLYVVKERPSFPSVAGALSVGVLYSSSLAILQFTLQHSVGGLFWLLGERTFALDTPGIARFDYCVSLAENCRLLLRPYATFPHPNVLGGFLATVLPIVASSFFSRNEWRKVNLRAVYHWVVLVSGSVALLLTFSRSAWIVGALGFMAMTAIIVLKGSFRRFAFPVAAIGVFSAGLITLAFVFYPSGADESVVRRIHLNTAAVALWKQSPLIGIGLGNFLVKLPSDTMARQINFLQPVHNIYLLILSEVGLIGFLLGVLVAFPKMRQLFVKPGNKHNNPFPGIYAISLCSLLLLGVVDHYPVTLQQGQLWLVLLIALNQSGENQ